MDQLHTYTYDYFIIGTLCYYDDGCHLRKYIRNPARANLTHTATRLSAWNVVIDRMHFSGHSDSWCRENCNPNNVKELEEVCKKYLICTLHFI